MTPPRAASHAPRRPVPAPERPRHLTVVEGGSAPGRRPRRTAAVISSIAVVSSLVLASVFSGQAGIQRTTLERRVAGLHNEVGLLELRLAEATTPQAILRRAQEIGMTWPDEFAVLERPSKREGRR